MVLKDLEKEKDDILLDKSPNSTVHESKIRNVKFIGEMTKFKLAPPGLILDMLSAILEDFNPELCVVLLQSCGRFLYVD